MAIIRIIQAKWTTARNRATHKNNVYRNINQWSDRYVCVYRFGLFWWRIFLWFRKNNFKFIHFLGHFLLLASPSTIIKWICWVCVCVCWRNWEIGARAFIRSVRVCSFWWHAIDTDANGDNHNAPFVSWSEQQVKCEKWMREDHEPWLSRCQTILFVAGFALCQHTHNSFALSLNVEECPWGNIPKMIRKHLLDGN